MKCPSLNPKKCDGELAIHTRETGIKADRHGEDNNDSPMAVSSVACNKCRKVWTRSALLIEGLNADDLHYSTL